MKTMQRSVGSFALFALAAVIPAGDTAFAQTRGAGAGPSSSQSPYVIRAVPGVVTRSILTVGDSVNLKPNGDPYRMVGIPDGLGAFDNGDGTFTVLMNHELGSSSGIARAHGAPGAFVSRWVISKDDLTVVSGEDLIQNVATWDVPLGANGAPGKGVAFNRFCSANLAGPGAFYNPASGLGTSTRIYMNGEETEGGRAFAHVVDGPEAGISWELPWLGKFAWENSVASPHPQDKTIVMGLDDSSRNFSSEGATDPSEVYAWVGDKQASGSEVAKAGLYYGVLHGVRVGTPGNYDANESTVASGERFELAPLDDQTNSVGEGPLQSESIAKSITQFRRVEDGAWDPSHPADFYFVTTDSFSGRSKLFRLRFDDVEEPEDGGVIDVVLDGTEGQRMMDNITIDGWGRILVQEDVGSNAHIGKIWSYGIDTDELSLVAEHDPARFVPGAPGFLTLDEESSGIIDAAAILGAGWFLLDVQAHYTIGGELVQGGQLLALHYPPGR